MSKPPSKQISIPRPSSSIILLSPTNQVLLLHRVNTSSSFPSAHVFPGGNLDAFHDGEDIPDVESEDRHRDGRAYRMAGVRECFEETGILLARGEDGGLLDVRKEEREIVRKRVYEKEVKFEEWVAEKGGVPDIDNLIPFTRWITPTNVPKRFTTQMYLYLLPLSLSSSSPSSLITATPDNGIEHTTAQFSSPHTFLQQARNGEIILFPPQYYLLSLLSKFIPHPSSSSSSSSSKDYATQREHILRFLKTTPTAETEKGVADETSRIPWGEKVMSPRSLFMREEDGRAVLGIENPGPELKGSGRGGDWERVVLARFTKGGPVEVEVKGREEMFEEERVYKASKGKGKL